MSGNAIKERVFSDFDTSKGILAERRPMQAIEYKTGTGG